MYEVVLSAVLIEIAPRLRDSRLSQSSGNLED
jgi:hypothetical protein